ncbi:MAG: transposase [Caldilineaceae bacterium]|nr:transposase [Caldilineaceae bacterium]
MQPSACFLLHRLRETMGDEHKLLSSVVEVDETYMGGLEKNKHRKKKLQIQGGTSGQQIVNSMRERGDQILLRPTHSIRKQFIEDEILNYVEEGAITYTDEIMSYGGSDEWYTREIVNHSKSDYVNEEVTEWYRDHLGTF